MLDFTLIETGEDFELLCADLLRAMKFRIDSGPSRGPDQGKDMIATREVRDDIHGVQEERFLIECKHHAFSGRSVKESEIGNFQGRMVLHHCNHNLLITSTIASVTVQNQIDALDKSTKFNERASCWPSNRLTEKLHEHPEVWMLHTDQPLPKQLSPRTFKTLDSVLDRSSEFFPNRQLFVENLIYFPSEEHQLMRQIETILSTQPQDRIALLQGDPASGKTVMGLTIAQEMEKNQDYAVLYQRLNAKTDLDVLWSDFSSYGDQKVLFIVDDCHLNLEVAAGIYYRFDSIQHAACLLISRKLPKRFRFSMDLDHLDIFEKLESDDRCFELQTSSDEQVRDKMSGIIQRYKEYYERTTQGQFIVGAEEWVIQNVHRNYLTLYFYLAFWTEAERLDQLDEKQVLEKVYHRYLDNNANRPYMDLLLRFAALYQYEIQFEPSQEADFEKIEFLTKQGLLELDPETEYYAFYHSDFAKLLLKSYASRPSFQRRYRNIQQFTVQQIQRYLLSFEDYPANLSEVFSNIITNNGIDIFKALLEDEQIKNQALCFYQNTGSVGNLVRFLSYLQRYCPRQLEFFLGSLTIENPSIKNLVLRTGNVFVIFVSLLKIIKDVDDQQYDGFLNLFDTQEVEIVLLKSTVHGIGFGLSIWSKFDYKVASTILNSIRTEQLASKVRDADLTKCGRALSNLNTVDRVKAQEIFQHLELEALVEKANTVEFGRLGNALIELNAVYSAKTRAIFQHLQLDTLVEKANTAELGRLGRALIELNSVDSAKTREIFQRLELDTLVEKANTAEFVQLGNALIELKTVDLTKTREIFQRLQLDTLGEKASTAKFEALGETLNRLNTVDSDKTRDIFQLLQLHTLVEQASTAEFGRLGNALIELNSVDFAKTRAIFQHIELDTLVEQAHTVEFGALGETLNRLNSVDSAKTRDIFQLLELDTLVESSRTAQFARLAKAVNELNSVDSAKTEKILERLDLGELVKSATSIKFIHLQNALCDFRLVSDALARQIWESIELNLVVPEAINTKYTTFLYQLPGLAQTSPTKTKDFILQLPDDFLFQFDYLKTLYNFNRLLFVFYTCECAEKADRLIRYAQEDIENFLRSKRLKDIASFLNLCANYFDIGDILLQYKTKWFGKVKYGEPAEIPYFIRVINDHDTELASDLLDHFIRNSKGKDEILAECFYQLGYSFAEKENFVEANSYLDKAISLFEKTGDDTGLCRSNFALAQNAQELNNAKDSRKLAQKALAYAQGQDMQELRDEIEYFIAELPSF